MGSRVVAALLTLTVLLSACDAGGDDGTAATRPHTTAQTPTTIATSTTLSFDVEVRRAAVELMEVRNQVFQAPDPARVAEYALPGCECFAREQQILTRFVEEGLRWSAPAVEPLGVRIVDPNPASPAMVLVAHLPAIEIVDAAGNIDESQPEMEQAAWIIRVAPAVRGDWRFVELDVNLDLDPAVAQAIVQEGIP